jgi:hypothetical protein
MLTEELNRNECPLSQKERRNIIRYYRKISATEILKIALIKKQPKKALQLYRRLKLSIGDISNSIFFRKAKY